MTPEYPHEDGGTSSSPSSADVETSRPRRQSSVESTHLDRGEDEGQGEDEIEALNTRMSKVAWRLHDLLRHFPNGHGADTELYLDKEDYHGLYMQLERLLQQGELDHLMSERKEFQEFMASLFSERYARLGEDDLGLREREKVRDEFYEKQVEHNKALKDSEGNAEIEASRHRFQAIQDEWYADEPATSELNELDLHEPAVHVPVAPAQGGDAPRQPFTTGWTYRPARTGRRPLFDPKETCEDFVTLGPTADKGGDVMDVDESSDGEDNDDDDDDDDEHMPDDIFKNLESTTKLNILCSRSRDEVAGNRKRRRAKLKRRKQQQNTEAVAAVTRARESLLHGTNTEPRTAEGTLREIKVLLEAEGFDSSALTRDDAVKLMEVEVEVPEPRFNQALRSFIAKKLQRLPQVEKDEDEDEAAGSTSPAKQVFDDGIAAAIHEYTGMKKTKTTASNKPRASTGVQGGAIPARSADQTDNGAPGPTSVGAYDENWLINWLKRNNYATDEDTQMMEYRGWRIHSPKVMLIRIKNFFCDEDMDRTLGWEENFGEIWHYLRYLRNHVWTGEQDWGYDLDQAMCMLRTHWIFEKLNHDRPELMLNFMNVKFPKRLRASPSGPDIVIASPMDKAKETVKPRYLVPRVPESIHDVDYQIPANVLRSYFLDWYRQDWTVFWVRPWSEVLEEGTAGSGSRGLGLKQMGYSQDFNMAEVEDAAYVKCIEAGPEGTSSALRDEYAFAMTDGSYVTLPEGSAVPHGDAARGFAEFRGAKRAALQQCLQLFGNDENVALQNHFRKLVLPTPFKERVRLRAERQKQIVYKPLALKEPPKAVKLDPFGFVYWHQQLDEDHGLRARNSAARQEASQKEWLRLINCSENEIMGFPSRNFNGPFRPSYLDSTQENDRITYRKLRSLHSVLERAHRRAPRELLETLLQHVGYGFDGDKVGTGVMDAEVEDEIKRQSQSIVTGHKGVAPGGGPKPVSEKDESWLRRFAGPSMNEKQIHMEVTPASVRMKVFMERIQRLLDEPWRGGVLASANARYTVYEILDAVEKMAPRHKLGAGIVSEYGIRFSAEEAECYCELMAAGGLLAVWSRGDGEQDGYYGGQDGKDLLVSRPECDLHPEDAINWYASDTHDMPGRSSQDDARAPDELPDLDTPTLDWTTAQVAAAQDASNIRSSTDRSLRERTSLALKLLGYRLGFWLRRTQDSVNTGFGEARDDGVGRHFSTRANLQLLQFHDLQESWRKEISSHGGQGQDAPTRYGAVVRAADPHVWRESMAEDTYNREALDVVRKRKIEELSEAANTLWPVRQQWHVRTAQEAAAGAEPTMTLHRESVWDFARGRRKVVDEARATYGSRVGPRRWFSINAWPVHLQTGERQAEIRDGVFQCIVGDIEVAEDVLRSRSMTSHRDDDDSLWGSGSDGYVGDDRNDDDDGDDGGGGAPADTYLDFPTDCATGDGPSDIDSIEAFEIAQLNRVLERELEEDYDTEEGSVADGPGERFWGIDCLTAGYGGSGPASSWLAALMPGTRQTMPFPETLPPPREQTQLLAKKQVEARLSQLQEEKEKLKAKLQAEKEEEKKRHEKAEEAESHQEVAADVEDVADVEAMEDIEIGGEIGGDNDNDNGGAAGDIGPKVHEAYFRKARFLPGDTEFWRGDTRNQRMAFREMAVQEVREVLPIPAQPPDPREAEREGARRRQDPYIPLPPNSPSMVPRSRPKGFKVEKNKAKEKKTPKPLSKPNQYQTETEDDITTGGEAEKPSRAAKRAMALYEAVEAEIAALGLEQQGQGSKLMVPVAAMAMDRPTEVEEADALTNVSADDEGDEPMWELSEVDSL